MRAIEIKKTRQARRVLRVRKRIMGTSERPRLAVSRTLRNIEVQIIDDVAGRTLCAASSRAKDLAGKLAKGGGNKKAAEAIGKLIGEKAKALGISDVAFDRRGRRYHGRIKALADAAREAGLKF